MRKQVWHCTWMVLYSVLMLTVTFHVISYPISLSVNVQAYYPLNLLWHALLLLICFLCRLRSLMGLTSWMNRINTVHAVIVFNLNSYSAASLYRYWQLNSSFWQLTSSRWQMNLSCWQMNLSRWLLNLSLWHNSSVTRLAAGVNTKTRCSSCVIILFKYNCCKQLLRRR